MRVILFLFLSPSNLVAFAPFTSIHKRSKLQFKRGDVHSQIGHELQELLQKEKEEAHGHAHLDQGSSVFENRILNVMIDQDTHCPLLYHEHDFKNGLPAKIESLPPELVNLEEFAAEMQGQIRQRVPSFNVKGYRSNAITDDLKNIEERQQGKHATVALTKRIKVVPAANLESVTHFKRESRILPRKHYPHKALPPTRNTSLEVGLLAERLGLPLSSRHLQAVLDCQSTTVAQRDKATKKKSWKKRWLECWQWTSLAIWAARRFQMLLRRK